MPIDILTDRPIDLKANKPKTLISPQSFRVTDSMFTLKHGHGNDGRLTVKISNPEGDSITNTFVISSLVSVIVIAFEQKLPTSIDGTPDTVDFETIELTSTVDISGTFSVVTDYAASFIAISGGHRIKKSRKQ